MADGKIYITISDTRGGSGAGVSNDADTESNKDKESSLKKYVAHKARNFIESEAKVLVNYTIGNYGNFTGDYLTQSELSQAMSGINFGIELGTAISMGAKGGWVGVLVAIATFGTVKGIQFGLQERSEKFQQARTNRNISIMRDRLGMNGLTNGSRSGGY